LAGIASVAVGSERELETAIALYIAQGYVLSNRSSLGATMFKKKEFRIVWAVIGFFLCILPLLIYLIVYASQSDQTVQIHLSSVGRLELPAPQGYGYGQRSADGQWWWDGRAWQPVAQPTLPAQSTPSQATPAQPALSSEWLSTPEPGAERPSESGGATPPSQAEPTPPQ
jgi:hypothetical protein